jgi:hypothetical protein
LLLFEKISKICGTIFLLFYFRAVKHCENKGINHQLNEKEEPAQRKRNGKY